MAELRQPTSRTTITSTRLQNVYNWSDFRGDPDRLMDKYFDVFLYLANWGTHRFMIRLAEIYTDKDDLLIRLIEGKDIHLRSELLRRFREERASAGPEPSSAKGNRRSPDRQNDLADESGNN